MGRGGGRRNFHRQDENDPLAQPEPAYECDRRVAWSLKGTRFAEAVCPTDSNRRVRTTARPVVWKGNLGDPVACAIALSCQANPAAPSAMTTLPWVAESRQRSRGAGGKIRGSLANNAS